MEEGTGRWGIIGHEWAVRLLARSLAQGQLAHAYLLIGPPRIGKTALALALAQAVNCRAARPPCGACRSCQLIAEGKHPDVRLITGGEVRAIHIDTVRDLQRELALSPLEGKRRVAILTDFQGATPEAANSLLKTLEEPPGQALLVLTASQRSRLLPTIVSRCQPLPLRPPSQKTIYEGLLARGVPAADAETLSHMAGGRVGWALQAAGEPALLEERARHLAALQDVLQADTLGRLRWARELCGDEDTLPALLDSWQNVWRDLLLWETGCREWVANVDQQQALAAMAQGRSVGQLVAGLQELAAARRRLDANVNPRLTLEVLFLRLGEVQP